MKGSRIKWIFLAISLLIAFTIVEIYDWGMYEFVSLAATFQFLLLLISKLGTTIPIRELTAFIYCIQLLIGSMLTYRVYPNIKIGFMSVSEDIYYPFTFSYLGAYLIGLFYPRFKNTEIDQRAVLMKSASRQIRSSEYQRIGLLLIIVAFISQAASALFPAAGLSFIYVILSMFRYVGLYYLWLAKYKYRYFFLAVIYIPFAVMSLGGGLFIELFIWGFLTFATFQLIKPFSFRTNMIAFLSGIMFVFLLQSVKVDFRKVAWKEAGKDMTVTQKLAFLGKLVTSVDFSDSKARDQANIRFIVRINQGYINAAILRNMPARRDFVDGEYFKDELMGILAPRFLFPDKAVVGDHEKFERFAGWRLSSRVAMSVSVLGDGYGNFGYWGGLIFCLLYGVFTNFLLHYVISLAKKHESTLILWIPMIFAFTMRCGDEFYIVVNHIFKSSLIILLLFVILKKSGYFLKSPTIIKRPVVPAPPAHQAG